MVHEIILLNPLPSVNIPSGLHPMGAYDNATNYAVGDSVDYLGSSYVMFVDAAAGTLPTDTTKWQVMANKGATGATGSTGATGATGSAGANGRVLNIVAGSNISVDATDPANPIVTNSKPDQTVAITAGTNITSVTGTYPNFTVNAATQTTDISGKLDIASTTYALLAGRSGGQTLIGGSAVTDILKLQGTSGNGTLTSPAIQALVGNNGATTALTVLNSGNVGIGTTAPTLSGTGKLHMAADRFRLDTAYTPATSGATGNTGEIAWDANYIYVAVATNTWMRATLSTF